MKHPTEELQDARHSTFGLSADSVWHNDIVYLHDLGLDRCGKDHVVQVHPVCCGCQYRAGPDKCSAVFPTFVPYSES